MIMHNPFSLNDKTIFVTGASSGIGRAIAIECAKLGAKIIITGRNEEKLKNTFCSLEGGGHSYIVADLADQDTFLQIVEQLPLLDGVVHCAGLTKTVPIQFVNDSLLKEVMNVNFVAPTLLTSLLVKKKKLARESSIVFISSINGIYCSSVASSIYAASKGAIHGLVKGLALDLASKNIRVNTVNPGMVETEIFSDNVISEEMLKKDQENYPLKRYGKPEEIAYAVIYLLSDAAKWVTGSSLLIDGGYTLK